MWLLGFVFFFELGDINSFSFAAPAIRIGWHLSISTIGFITSATFVGMFVGATTGGWFSALTGDRTIGIPVCYTTFSRFIPNGQFEQRNAQTVASTTPLDSHWTYYASAFSDATPE
jgi:MFS family permease